MVSYHMTWCYRFTLVPGIIDVYLFHSSYSAILMLKDIGQRTENKSCEREKGEGGGQGKEKVRACVIGRCRLVGGEARGEEYGSRSSAGARSRIYLFGPKLS